MIKAEFLTRLVTAELLGSKYAQLTEAFCFYSPSLRCQIMVPIDFICDYESVPLFKATSKRAGVLHDYLCRLDSLPLVTKQQAATVYAEAQQLRDMLYYAARPYTRFKRFKLFYRATLRWFKTSVVRVTPGYFHKFSINATVKDLCK